MDRTDEQRINDYLDDRMNAEERSAFEKELDQDAVLSRRIDAERQVGRLLRESEIELSPGFYTRARARFAENSGNARRRRLGPLSWQMIGVAAAAMLAVVIFLPGLREGRTVPLIRSAPDEAPTPQNAPGKEELRAFADSDLETARELPMKEADVLAPSASPPPAPARSSRPVAYAPAPPEEKQAKARGAATVPAETAAGEPLPAGGRPADEAAEREQIAEMIGRLEQAEVARSGAKKQKSSAQAFEAGVELDEIARTQGLQAVGLAEGLAEAGIVRRVGSHADERTGDERALWWIGPRATLFRCSGMTGRIAGGRYEIRLAPPTADEPASPGGCAVVLPLGPPTELSVVVIDAGQATAGD